MVQCPISVIDNTLVTMISSGKITEQIPLPAGNLIKWD